MMYVRPIATLQNIESGIVHTQSGLNLTADCSGRCAEPGYDGYPNYVSCSNGDWDFTVFLPGEAISASEILDRCSLSVNDTPLDISHCIFDTGPKPCGDIGFANYYFKCPSLASCASERSTVTISCDGYNQGGPCDYDNITPP